MAKPQTKMTAKAPSGLCIDRCPAERPTRRGPRSAIGIYAITAQPNGQEGRRKPGDPSISAGRFRAQQLLERVGVVRLGLRRRDRLRGLAVTAFLAPRLRGGSLGSAGRLRGLNRQSAPRLRVVTFLQSLDEVDLGVNAAGRTIEIASVDSLREHVAQVSPALSGRHILDQLVAAG